MRRLVKNLQNMTRPGWRAVLVSVVILMAVPAFADPASGSLEQAFAAPPDATKPRCYWYFMDGHMSKEGVTHDLEAMRKIGIGEAYVAMISGQSQIPPGPIKILSEPFWDLMAHTVREGGRLGVNIGIFNSPGWSQSGGPWVRPEQSMRYMSTLETPLHGPQHYVHKLAAPSGFFQDVALIAFPVASSDKDTELLHSPTFSTVPPGPKVDNLFDGDPHTAFTVAKGQAVLVKTGNPFTVRSLNFIPSGALTTTCTVEALDDGVTFHPVTKVTIDRHRLMPNVGPVPLAPVMVAINPTTATTFRLTFSRPAPLAEITLSGAARLQSYADKQLLKVFESPQPPFDFYSWPPQPDATDTTLAIKPSGVQTLSGKMAADGTLTWDVPAGDWIVQRVVALPTGTTNGPAAPEATGPEVDKMNHVPLAAHFQAYIGELLRRLPASDRTAWKHVVADSYETGPQNYTDGFLDDFQSRYGYDARAYLPVLTGRLVGSADQSDRFLWDVRRMVADRISSEYVGGLRDLCHQNNLRMWLENYGHWGFPGEFLQYGGASDEISGEFWATGVLGSVELRDASSAAHIYGKPVVWSEAFTAGPFHQLSL